MRTFESARRTLLRLYDALTMERRCLQLLHASVRRRLSAARRSATIGSEDLQVVPCCARGRGSGVSAGPAATAGLEVLGIADRGTTAVAVNGPMPAPFSRRRLASLAR